MLNCGVITGTRTVAILAVLAASTACAGTGSSRMPLGRGVLKLAGYHGGATGAGMEGTPLGKPATFSTYPLCAAGGPVQIRAVQLVASKGMELADWGTTQVPPLEPTDFHWGFARDSPRSTRRPIRVSCDQHDTWAVLDVTMRIDAPVGITHGFRVLYGGGSLYVPYQVILCRLHCQRVLDNTPPP